MEIPSRFNSEFTSDPRSQYIDAILILWLTRDPEKKIRGLLHFGMDHWEFKETGPTGHQALELIFSPVTSMVTSAQAVETLVYVFSNSSFQNYLCTYQC